MLSLKMKSTTLSTSMSTFILLFMGIPVLCSGSTDAHINRIIGGRVVRIEDYPYMASFRRNNQTFCGGSIINQNTVLTAAHCLQRYWENPGIHSVVVSETLSNGMGHGQVFSINRAIQHSEYNADYFYNDIALLKINGEFSYSKKVQRIKLWSGVLPVGEKATISGWGHTSENSTRVPAQPLKAAKVPIVSNEKCQQAYRQHLEIKDGTFCAGFVEGGVDTCQGDSGGPIVYKNRQIGIVSFGIGCATAQYPGVYTNVAKYKEWIEQNV